MADTRGDWFVAANAASVESLGGGLGDGSREKPFRDPWLALRVAGPGDVIHIAAGTYWGRYDRSSWIVDCPNLTLLGGYSRDFSKRTPWQTPSVFAAYAGYEGPRENNLISGHGDYSGLVLDGLYFDAGARNTYGEGPEGGITGYSAMDGPIASFNASRVTIRNCIFANSAQGAVDLSGEGSRFENNLIVNTVGIGMLHLRNSASAGGQPITVANNTFAFAHDEGPPCGTGADRAIGIRLNGPTVVQENVFVSCGNAAVSVYRDLDRISIERNVFYLTPRALVSAKAQSTTGEITEQGIDELEDLGFKSVAGNTVQDPGVTGLRAQWLDAYSRHLLANYVKPPRDAANALRTTNGLSALAPADLEDENAKGAFAPRLEVVDALAIRSIAKAGFHAIELASDLSAPAPRVERTYRPIDWSAIEQADSSLANQPVELRVGLGAEQNTNLLAELSADTHMGIRVYRPGTDDGSIFVLAKRYTAPSRQFEEAMRYSNGREVESTYLLRGIYRSDVVSSSRQPVTLVVESIVPAPPTEPSFARPSGRNWFVRAGSSGGDGSLEKPFRDPFQALDKAEGGDTIHVAAGDYFGKLKSGQWKIALRNLTLLGGYDSEFKARDPWTNATRFLLNSEERAKGTPEGTVLASAENSEGLTLDGFVFDGATYNAYSKDGALDLRNSPRAPLVSLIGGRAPISVRNCLFVNASGAAIGVSCPYGVFENNIVANTSGYALNIRADGPGPWTIRNNTILFASDPTGRAGTGHSSSEGSMLLLSGRATAIVDSNVFAFADQFGVRCTLPHQNVSFDNNVIAAALYMYLTDSQYLWADGANGMRRAADAGFSSFNGNSFQLPRLGVDATFADAALTRLFAISSRVSTKQWEDLAAQIGASVRPEVPADASAAEPAKPAQPAPAPSGASSLSDILSSLSSMKDQLKEIDSHKVESAVAQPVYCPVFDWRKAMDLAARAPDGPGAHRANLSVSFAEAPARNEVQYVLITPQLIDADHAALDSKPVELEITDARSSPANRALYPEGLASGDYSAFSVTTTGEATRTRLALIVRLDTRVSKVLDRTVSADKLRVRGTARIPGNPGALSIVVDSAELIAD
jgi:hypothetical protein